MESGFPGINKILKQSNKSSLADFGLCWSIANVVSGSYWQERWTIDRAFAGSNRCRGNVGKKSPSLDICHWTVHEIVGMLFLQRTNWLPCCSQKVQMVSDWYQFCRRYWIEKRFEHSVLRVEKALHKSIIIPITFCKGKIKAKTYPQISTNQQSHLTLTSCWGCCCFGSSALPPGSSMRCSAEGSSALPPGSSRRCSAEGSSALPPGSSMRRS